MGTNCPLGPIVLGTICLLGPNVWGPIVQWDQLYWGRNEPGLFVLGDQLWGTKCPGTECVRDQMRSSQKSTEKEEAIQVECANENEITLSDGRTLSSEPWLETMSKEEVDGLIKNSTGEYLGL